MSRTRSRARKRRRRLEDGLREAIHQARNADAKASQSLNVTPGHGALWQLLCDIERSGLCVWDVARAIRCTEEEKVMIAQAVAPSLAGMTPGNVLRRQQLPERRRHRCE
ncbi:MAG TPA: hypothetical protein VH592_08380 [Gemmataceae bacterium]|jgi:hypothetical protein